MNFSSPLPDKFKNKFKVDSLGITRLDKSSNRLSVTFFGRRHPPLAFKGTDWTFGHLERFVSLKYMIYDEIEKWEELIPLEIAVMKRLYFCAGVCQLIDYFFVDDFFCVVTERPNENCVPLGELIELDRKPTVERLEPEKKYSIRLTERDVKKLFAKVLAIADECRSRGVCHGDLRSLHNFWVDLKTRDVYLWNFEHADFVDRTTDVTRQLGFVLEALMTNVAISVECENLIKLCKESSVDIKTLRRHYWLENV